MSTTGYGLEEQINDLNAELRDTRATLRQSLQHRDTLRAELAEARAQIAAKDEQLLEMRAPVLAIIAQRDKAEAQIADLTNPAKMWMPIRVHEEMIADMDAELEQARAQIAAKEAALREVRMFANMDDIDMVMRLIDEALAAPAQEPKQKPMYSLEEESDDD